MIYIDGVLTMTGVSAGYRATCGDGMEVSAGFLSAGNYRLAASIGEIMITNSKVFDPGWIMTEYANENSPSTFYAIGSETNPVPMSDFWPLLMRFME